MRPRRGNHTPAGASPRRSFQPTISRRGKPVVASPRRLRYHSYERVKAAATDPRSGRCLYSDSPDGNGVDPNPEFKTATMSDYTVANVRALARVGQTPPNRISYPCRYPRRNLLSAVVSYSFYPSINRLRRNPSSMLEGPSSAVVSYSFSSPKPVSKDRAETCPRCSPKLIEGPMLRETAVTRRLTVFAETRPMLEGPRLDLGHCPYRNYSQLRRRNTRD